MDGMSELARGLVPSMLLIGALLIVRRGAVRGKIRGGDKMRVAERAGVARGASVAVVEIDGRRFLVGASEHGVNLLSELDGQPPVTAAAAAPTDQIRLPDTGVVGDMGLLGDARLVPDDARHLHPGSFAGRKEAAAGSSDSDRPRSGLIHRLQSMTVRTHVEAPLRDYI